MTLYRYWLLGFCLGTVLASFTIGYGVRHPTPPQPPFTVIREF
jgi:hypothetical protein